MIKNKPLPDNIHALLIKAGAYLQSRKDVAFAYLFGSLSTAERKPLSDVDIAVFLSRGDKRGEKKLEILGDLSDLLNTDEVDLVDLHTESLPLKIRVIKTGTVIADNDPFERHNFESLTIRQYLDFAVKEKAILERRFLNG
jgi:uncharacterized protein